MISEYVKLNTLKFNLISFLEGLKVKNFPTFLFSFKSNLKARKSIWNGNWWFWSGKNEKLRGKLDLKWIPVSMIYFLKKSSIAGLSTLGQFSGFEHYAKLRATWGASAPGLKFDASIHWTNREPFAIHAAHSLAKLCHSIERDVNNWSLVFSRRNRRLGDLHALISPDPLARKTIL